MVFFYSATIPFGIYLGMGIQTMYDETRRTSLIMAKVLNMCSALILIYMALDDLVLNKLFGPKLQGDKKLESWVFCAFFLGLLTLFAFSLVEELSLMAKWAYNS